MIGGPFDGAQLPGPLALTDSEFSWYIFESAGGARRLAGLVSIHRTGPRPRSFALGPQLITARDLPPPLSDLVPAWLPILSPVRIATDDRPLFMVALYDLDARTPPLVLEHEIEHADFDPARFAASAMGGALSLRIDDDGAAAIHAQTQRFSLDLRARPIKPAVVFGDGSPTIRHGNITTSYVQRPRLDVTGDVQLGDERIAFAGDGVHDHQWLRVSVPNLKWIWPHLRFPDGRELTGYVIRDSTGSRHADADDGAELGRGAWLIERDGTVHRLQHFDIRATAHTDTERGRVPTHFAFDVPELALELRLVHVLPCPYLRLRVFGDALDGGLYEGPVDARGLQGLQGGDDLGDSSDIHGLQHLRGLQDLRDLPDLEGLQDLRRAQDLGSLPDLRRLPGVRGWANVRSLPGVRGWVEVLNAAHVRLRLDAVAEG